MRALGARGDRPPAEPRARAGVPRCAGGGGGTLRERSRTTGHVMHTGVAVSPGVVVGVAYRVDTVFGASEPQHLADPGQIPGEIERFDRAVAASTEELENIVTKVAQQLGSP